MTEAWQHTIITRESKRLQNRLDSLVKAVLVKTLRDVCSHPPEKRSLPHRGWRICLACGESRYRWPLKKKG